MYCNLSKGSGRRVLSAVLSEWALGTLVHADGSFSRPTARLGRNNPSLTKVTSGHLLSFYFLSGFHICLKRTKGDEVKDTERVFQITMSSGTVFIDGSGTVGENYANVKVLCRATICSSYD